MRTEKELEDLLHDLDQLVKAAARESDFEANQQIIAAWSMLRWVLGKSSPGYDELIKSTKQLLLRRRN